MRVRLHVADEWSILQLQEELEDRNTQGASRRVGDCDLQTERGRAIRCVHVLGKATLSVAYL